MLFLFLPRVLHVLHTLSFLFVSVT